jgi:hypothetical protein
VHPKAEARDLRDPGPRDKTGHKLRTPIEVAGFPDRNPAALSNVRRLVAGGPMGHSRRTGGFGTCYRDHDRVEAREISLGGDGASRYAGQSRREAVKTFIGTLERWACAVIAYGRDVWFWALTLQPAAVVPAVVPATTRR